MIRRGSMLKSKWNFLHRLTAVDMRAATVGVLWLSSLCSSSLPLLRSEGFFLDCSCFFVFDVCLFCCVSVYLCVFFFTRYSFFLSCCFLTLLPLPFVIFYFHFYSPFCFSSFIFRCILLFYFSIHSSFLYYLFFPLSSYFPCIFFFSFFFRFASLLQFTIFFFFRFLLFPFYLFPFSSSSSLCCSLLSSFFV